MGDEEEGEVELSLEASQQVEQLRLNRHVERGGGLVEDDEAWLGHECACEPDTLALPAGELVWVGVGVARLQPALLEHLLHPLPRLTAAGDAMEHEGFGHQLADGAARVERRRRILEHDLHVAPQLPDARRACRCHLLPSDHDTPLVRVLEAEEAARGRRLTASALADQRDRLAGADLERDVVDGMEVLPL